MCFWADVWQRLFACSFPYMCAHEHTCFHVQLQAVYRMDIISMSTLRWAVLISFPSMPFKQHSNHSGQWIWNKFSMHWCEESKLQLMNRLTHTWQMQYITFVQTFLLQRFILRGVGLLFVYILYMHMCIIICFGLVFSNWLHIFGGSHLFYLLPMYCNQCELEFSKIWAFGLLGTNFVECTATAPREIPLVFLSKQLCLTLSVWLWTIKYNVEIQHIDPTKYIVLANNIISNLATLPLSFSKAHLTSCIIITMQLVQNDSQCFVYINRNT